MVNSMWNFDKEDRVENACRKYCDTALRKYELTGVKTPIPFYKDMKNWSKKWRWYDTGKIVTYQSLLERGIM